MARKFAADLAIVPLSGGSRPEPPADLDATEQSIWKAVVDACAYRKSHPAILMVQSAQDRAADDIPGPLNAARKRGILVQ